jgi:hypothetical protein
VTGNHSMSRTNAAELRARQAELRRRLAPMERKYFAYRDPSDYRHAQSVERRVQCQIIDKLQGEIDAIDERLAHLDAGLADPRPDAPPSPIWCRRTSPVVVTPDNLSDKDIDPSENCVVAALSFTFGMPASAVRATLISAASNNEAVFDSEGGCAWAPLHRWLRSIGWQHYKCAADQRMARRLPTTALLEFRGHMACIVDGTFFGIHETSRLRAFWEPPSSES